MLKRNIGFKLLALIIAIVIWAYANKSQNPNISRELILPLEIHNIEAGCIVTAVPKSVKVRLEGPKTQINSIAADPDAAVAYVSLKDKMAGRHSLPVIVRLPTGLAGLVGTIATPRKVSVALERKIQRTLNIGTQFAGSPPVGYRFGTPKLSPGKAVISGIAKSIDAVGELVVVVELGDSGTQNIDGVFSIIAQDKYGNQIKGLEITPKKAHLKLELLESPANRVVFISVNTVGRPPFPYKIESITVEPDTVTVTGRPEQLEDINTLKTEPVYLGSRTKTFSQKVRIIAPADLTPADGRYVQVTVKIISSETKQSVTSDQ